VVKFRKPVQRSEDLIDRRGSSGRRPGLAVGAGGGGIAIIIAIIVALMGGGGGGGLEDILNQLQPPASSVPGQSPLEGAPDPEAAMVDFMSVVLDDNQALWAEVFANNQLEYRNAKLTLFTEAIDSGCGGADSRMGPHYCPLDENIYLDLGFFNDLQTRFGATGDLAPAYVLSHEIGHHVQNLLGIDDEVRSQQQASPSEANDLSVRMELQADCFAGVWASTVFVGQLPSGEDLAIDPGEISEALEAAAAVGDDRIQEAIQGRVDPESFTHGTSEQRQQWFTTGYETGDPAACDTFSASL
jgi:predicted metalloprotease